MPKTLGFLGAAFVLVLALLPSIQSAGGEGEAAPPGVKEIDAPYPLEISGVASVPGGYVVVGDDTVDHGRVWPGGEKWPFPGGKPIRDVESIDVGFAPDGRQLWLVLGEEEARLVDQTGASSSFSDYKEECGRGLEGVAVRWKEGRWEVAILWEGGFLDPRRCKAKKGEWKNPRAALFYWTLGAGAAKPHLTFELQVPRPNGKDRFRAPDLVWDGEGLLVLLSSSNLKAKGWSHTWLQKFDLTGQPVSSPTKLQQVWGSYWKGKNWEALDWTLDGKSLVMGYDEKSEKKRRALVVFPWP